MKQYLFATVALTAALSFAGRAQAAAAETVVGQAVGDQQPSVVAFYDSADGKTSGIDSQMSQNIAAALAGSQYLLTDAGHLQVLPASGSGAQPILPVVNAVDVSNNQGLYYLVHLRSGNDFLDGAVSRDPQDASANYAIIDLVLFDQQGDSEAIHIEQNLTWATNPGAGTNGTGGLNPGTSNPTGNLNPPSGSSPTDSGSPQGGDSSPQGGGGSPLGGEPAGGSSPSVF